MAVGYGSSTSTGANDSLVTSISVPVPAGVVAGDHIYVALEQWEAANPTVTMPAGFELLGQVVSGPSKMKVFVKQASGSDSGTYTFSWSGTQWSLGHAVRVTGGKAVSNPTGASFNTATAASGTAIPNTSVTVGFVPGLLQWSCNENGGTQTTPPTGFTEVQDSNYLHSNHRMTAVSSGTFSAPSGVLSVSTLILAMLVAIEPAASGATVTGVAAAPLGALTATAGGTASVSATATASLGGLSAAVAGTVTPVSAGLASSPLGALTATASGTRTDAGVAAAPFGLLASTATGTVTAPGGGTADAPLGALTATVASSVTVNAAATAALGALIATGAGTRATTATAAALLGGLVASATGTRFTTGTAVALLGALTATTVVTPPATFGSMTVTTRTVTAMTATTRPVAGMSTTDRATTTMGG